MEIEKIKAQKMHEIDEMKIAFFSNISHELRTPLTLMLGPLNTYFQNPSMGLPHNKISLLFRNAKRLHHLIDQLLDLRKIDVGKLHPRIIKGDLVQFIHDVLPSYISYANQLKIHFSFETSASSMDCYYDEDKIEKIISNLISNSLKFTAENGSIFFTLDFVNRKVADELVNSPDSEYHVIDKTNLLPHGNLFTLITMSDTGKGIKKEEINLIFNRFYQSPQKNTWNFSNGSGIGLSLIKDLIKILHGHLFLKSEQGKGTTFKILLPVDRKSFLDNEISTQGNEKLHSSINVDYTEQPETLNLSESKSPSEPINKSDEIILIVEDHEDLKNYLDEFLSKSYTVITARNGKEGLEIALNERIDLILSDLMMPDMDGMEFCKHIKNDERTSHIPFIMLTARESTDSQLAGLESGSDDYIIKPFHDSILITKIKNTLNFRKELREKFRGDLNIIPEGIKLANRDQDFLKKIIQLVESDISNSEFDKEDFYRQIGMSRTQVYRKLNSLTNQSVNEFIRNIRLKKAAEILKCSKNISISELAYTVGFSNPNYFTRVFREHFGVTPTQYCNNFFHASK
jgi:DNA-binding response OmpR family regulator/nitrogen-specific signal transduction histidine kinase